MQTPETTPLRFLPQDRSKQKCQTQQKSNCKRSLQYNQQDQQYNTIKKYNSINLINRLSQNQIQHNQQLEELQERSDVVPNIRPQLSIIQQQQSVVSSSLPIRQRVSHLLPGYMGAGYTVQQRKLIQGQIKLDQLLDFLRLHRQKIKGELFSNLKSTLISNHQITLQIQHLKQIMYIRPDFYICTQKRDQKNRFDILISLAETAQLEERKIQFRKSMYNHLIQKQAFNKNYKIPKYVFPFEIKQQEVKKQINIEEKRKKNIFSLLKSSNMRQINPLDALKPGNTKNFQQLLLNKIRQKQQKIKKEKQSEKNIKYGKNQLLAILDELPKIYKKRLKSSMFKSSIIHDLDQSLNLRQDVICKIFQVLIKDYPQFFKIIEHKDGQIIQIQVKMYNQIRQTIQKSQVNLKKQNIQMQNLQQKQQVKKIEKLQTKQSKKKINKSTELSLTKSKKKIKQQIKEKNIKL